MECRICSSKHNKKYFYPNVIFNNKVFTYYKCSNCKSVSIFPTPSNEDFSKMYGENDHTYLKDLKGELQYNFNYPFANHQGYQIYFLRKLKSELNNKTLLDYGCGSGYYMKYAENCGAQVVGIEFGKDFCKILSNKSKMQILTIDEFEIKFKNEKFDFIHLGHILEHLPVPSAFIKWLKTYAHSDTTLLIDGPLDKNFCLSRLYLDIGSRIKSKKSIELSPQHLSLTTRKSQFDFFVKNNLNPISYKVVEQYHPLPNKFAGLSFKSFNYLLASFSIFLSSIVPRWGNVFHLKAKFIF